jgi:DNA-binding Lrp family transcriptional regulator
MRAVYALMQDGQWRTLAVIAEECKASEASVSARLRDLRKLRYGGYFVERRRVRSDLWEYRLDITKSAMEHPNGS